MLVLFSFFFLININAFIFSNSIIMLLFCLQIKKKKQWPEIKLRSFSEAINLFVRLEFCWALWATLIMRDCALSTQHNYKSGPQSNDLESLPGAVGIPPVWTIAHWIFTWFSAEKPFSSSHWPWRKVPDSGSSHNSPRRQASASSS